MTRDYRRGFLCLRDLLEWRFGGLWGLGLGVDLEMEYLEHIMSRVPSFRNLLTRYGGIGLFLFASAEGKAHDLKARKARLARLSVT